MKSSLCGMIPWTHSQRSRYKPEAVNQNPTGLTASNLDSDMMETVCRGANHHCPLSQTRQRKMPPLLRLDSEGEISTGKNFCDKAVNNQFDKINNHLRLSSSFDASCNKAVAASPKSTKSLATSAGRSFDSSNSASTNKNIPCPSFKKSLSCPNGLPIHQSFPPPSSSSSAITKHFSAPMADRFSPFSSNPRVLGIVNIFNMSSHQLDNDDMQLKPGCAKTSSPCANSYFMSSQVNAHDSSACRNVEKMNALKSNGIVRDKSLLCSDCDNSLEANSSSSKCDESSQNSSQSFKGNDNSAILLIRKKKKKRSRNKKKKEMKQGHDNMGTPFRPSSCSSPLKSTVNTSELGPQDTSTSTANKACASGVLNVKIVSPIVQSKKKKEQQSSPVDTTRSSPREIDSDLLDETELSDDDLVFEDSSFVIFENSSPSPSNSKVSLKDRKCRRNRNSKASDESDDEQKSSSSGLHFTLSLTLSEDDDEDNDSSVDWDTSTSPSESNQFLFEFEFNTGLSLDSIIGHASSSDCPETRALQKKLQDLNKKWNEVYSSPACDDIGLMSHKNQQKVHFACEEDLTTVHFVGDEDRAGEWHRFALERERFQKRVGEVEKVLAPVLCENHRSNVFNHMVLSE